MSLRADSTLRAPWFEVSCCPANVARTLASAAMYFATADDAGVQLHQYGTYQVSTSVGGREVALSVESGYPFDGDVRVTVETPGPLELRLRVPSWAVGTTWIVPDAAVASLADGWLSVRGEFAAGDEVTLSLPIETRFTYPDPFIDAVRGQVAVERGPLVLALESTALPDGVDVGRVRLDTTVVPSGTTVGVEIVAESEASSAYDPAPASGRVSERAQVNLLPYYQWGNRGPATMRVFIPLTH